MLNLYYTNKDPTLISESSCGNLLFSRKENKLAGPLILLAWQHLKNASVNEWLTNITNDLFDYDNVFRAACGFAWV